MVRGSKIIGDGGKVGVIEVVLVDISIEIPESESECSLFSAPPMFRLELEVEDTFFGGVAFLAGTLFSGLLLPPLSPKIVIQDQNK